MLFTSSVALSLLGMAFAQTASQTDLDVVAANFERESQSSRLESR